MAPLWCATLWRLYLPPNESTERVRQRGHWMEFTPVVPGATFGQGWLETAKVTSVRGAKCCVSADVDAVSGECPFEQLGCGEGGDGRQAWRQLFT